MSWGTWLITAACIALWCITAYQVALAAGARTWHDILANVWSGAQNADVLVAYGARENSAILAGQYWRFVTPVFLHANLLHVGLNMLNLVVLGVMIERIFGHLRFALIYMVTGVVSVIASFLFMPNDVSVGASGAVFGIVGAYSVFMVMHRKAFGRRSTPIIVWLVLIIGVNLGLGLVIPGVDNYAHVGGLVSGVMLGWLFAPFYVVERKDGHALLVDKHRLARRWPLALLTIAATLVFAYVALHLMGG